MKKNACILKKPVICFFTDLSLVVEIRYICLHRRQVHSGESSHMRSAEGVAVKWADDLCVSYGLVLSGYNRLSLRQKDRAYHNICMFYSLEADCLSAYFYIKGREENGQNYSIKFLHQSTICMGVPWSSSFWQSVYSDHKSQGLQIRLLPRAIKELL